MAAGTVTESSFRIGLARAFYAKRQSDGKYSAPVEFEFPEECDIKINGGDAQSIYAGDASRWRKAGATSKELSVQMTHFKRSFLQDCLGFVAESTTGGITDTGSGKASDFAFGIETTGDQGAYRQWFFCCTATTPVHKAQTNTDNIQEDSETSTFTAVPVKCGDGVTRIDTTFETGDSGYETAFEKVPFQGAGA